MAVHLQRLMAAERRPDRRLDDCSIQVNCAEGSGTTSAMVNPDGTLHSFQPWGQEGLLVADLNLSASTGLLAARCRTNGAG